MHPAIAAIYKSGVQSYHMVAITYVWIGWLALYMRTQRARWSQLLNGSFS